MTIPLLALCARETGSDALYERLATELRHFARRGGCWDGLVHEAERHGLAPLLKRHVDAAGHPLPKQARRVLQSLALRSGQANRIRNEAVAVLLERCRRQGVEVLLVKGIALANLIYSEPGLRPMRDVDLLAAEADLAKIREIAGELGYLPEVRQDIPADFYHLVPLVAKVEGMPITIEIHRNLLPYHAGYPPWPLERSLAASQPLTVGGCAARTLCLEEMLLHVYLHGFRSPLTYEPYRLVHLADLVTLIEQRLTAIDWPKVRALFPALQPVLSALHWLTPWSEEVAQRLDLDVVRSPQRPGEPYRGWPLRRLRSGKISDIAQLLDNTLLPSPWWLQVYYGCRPGRQLLRARLVEHPLALYRWFKAFRHERRMAESGKNGC